MKSFKVFFFLAFVERDTDVLLRRASCHSVAPLIAVQRHSLTHRHTEIITSTRRPAQASFLYSSDVPVLQLVLYALVCEKTGSSVYEGIAAPHCLGQILSSTIDTRMRAKFAQPTRNWNCRIASMNGADSMSPTVPPSFEVMSVEAGKAVQITRYLGLFSDGQNKRNLVMCHPGKAIWRREQETVKSSEPQQTRVYVQFVSREKILFSIHFSQRRAWTI